jgi:hypothetical protein
VILIPGRENAHSKNLDSTFEFNGHILEIMDNAHRIETLSSSAGSTLSFVVQTTLAKIDGKFYKSLILKEMSKHPSVPNALKAAYDKARSVSMNAFKYRQSPVKNDKNE